MIRPVEQPDLDVERVSHGESLSIKKIYKLGIDKQQILLRSESDFRNIVLDMAKQARQSIRIYSPLLCHELFYKGELSQIASMLARRNKYTWIEILIFDPHRVIKHGHALLTISRRLPSSINIRIVDPEMRKLNHEFVLIDHEGVIYRQDYDKFEGRACFKDIAEYNRLGREFSAAWDSGLLDPNLRQLCI